MSLVSDPVSRSWARARRRVRRFVLAAGLAIVWMTAVHGCANRGMEESGDAGDLTGASGGAAGHATGGQVGGAAGSRATGGAAGGSSGGGGAGGAAGAGPASGGGAGTGAAGRAGAGGGATGGAAGIIGTGGRAGAGRYGRPSGCARKRWPGRKRRCGGSRRDRRDGRRGGWQRRRGRERRPGRRSWRRRSRGGRRGGAGQGAPCAGLCANPVVFTAVMYQSGNLGTNATCHQTTAAVQGLECGNFVTPRHLTVNGQAFPCTGTGMPLPAPVNGGYCIQTTAGDYSFAYFGTLLNARTLPR